MSPLLGLASDGRTHRVADAVKTLAEHFQLTEDELVEQLPSGRAPLFYNRVAWAIFHLRKAGLFSTPKRAHFQISALGRSVVDRSPSRIDLALLAAVGSQAQTQASTRFPGENETAESMLSVTTSTPREQLGSAYQQIREQLIAELREVIGKTDPIRFESIVVDLLVRMGYGGNVTDASRAIKRSGDEGIDGVIKEDHLGLENIYIQAKRWQDSVGRPEIQKFAGALQGQRARKGIFITTSTFTKGAEEYVERIDNRIVLLDGRRLCELMIEFDVGVNTTERFELKRIDLDFFSED